VSGGSHGRSDTVVKITYYTGTALRRIPAPLHPADDTCCPPPLPLTNKPYHPRLRFESCLISRPTNAVYLLTYLLNSRNEDGDTRVYQCTGWSVDGDDVWKRSVSDVREGKNSERVRAVVKQVTDGGQQTALMYLMYRP